MIKGTISPDRLSVMDMNEIVSELKNLLDKYPTVSNTELETMRVLSNNLSVDCSNILWELTNY